MAPEEQHPAHKEEYVGVREFDIFQELVIGKIDEGFKETHRRQDQTNGRLGKHDTEILQLLSRLAEHHTSIQIIETKQQEHSRRTDPEYIQHTHSRSTDLPVDPGGDNSPITIRDLKRMAFLVVLTVGLTVTVAVFVMQVIMDRVK